MYIYVDYVHMYISLHNSRHEMAQGVQIGSLLGSAIRPKAKDGSRRRPVELNESMCVCVRYVFPSCPPRWHVEQGTLGLPPDILNWFDMYVHKGSGRPHKILQNVA